MPDLTKTVMTDELARGELLSRQEGYYDFEQLIRKRGAAARDPLFTTDAAGLWDAYLGGIPGESHYGACTCGADRTGPSAEAHAPSCPAATLIHTGRRQHYNCAACRRFIETYGGLVTIIETGIAVPVFWGSTIDTPPFFAESEPALVRAVGKARVTGVFYSADEVWGTPQAGGWSHLACLNPKRFTDSAWTAPQAMSEKKQDYIMLKRALAEIPLDAAREAVRVLHTDHLASAEKARGMGEWFLKLKEQLEVVGAGPKHAKRGGRVYDNLVWLAVATAPPGFAHVRSVMLGTLFDDLLAGLPFEQVQARWQAKMHPLQYKRPTAPPKEGAIKQAEELVARLGTAGALERRFASLKDVLAANGAEGVGGWKGKGILWLPLVSVEVPPTGEVRKGGVFDHLRESKKPLPAVELPAQAIRWTKFRDEVLLQAHTLEVKIPTGRAPFYGLVTAANPEAPPILQWDGLTTTYDLETDPPQTVTEPLPRNPVSWYFYYGGSTAWQWGLWQEGAVNLPKWAKVTAVLSAPPHWQRPEQFKHHGEMALFALEGCRDAGHTASGGFFPAMLRSEYHGARSVLEAYANRATIAGKDAEGQVNGLALQKPTGRSGEQVYPLHVRVTAAAGVSEYVIDRWD